MPGYGYAAVVEGKSASWGRLARDYLRGRPSLLRVFVLVDGRHGLKENDHETMKLLDASAVSYAVVLTKRDEVKLADREARVEATLEALRKHVAAYPEVIFTSSRTGDGVPELRAHIARLLAERAAAAPQAAPRCHLKPKSHKISARNPGSRERSAPYFCSFSGQNSQSAARRGRSTPILDAACDAPGAELASGRAERRHGNLAPCGEEPAGRVEPLSVTRVGVRGGSIRRKERLSVSAPQESVTSAASARAKSARRSAEHLRGLVADKLAFSLSQFETRVHCRLTFPNHAVRWRGRKRPQLETRHEPQLRRYRLCGA